MAFIVHRLYRIPTSSFSHIYTMNQRTMCRGFLAFTVFFLACGPNRHFY